MDPLESGDRVLGWSFAHVVKDWHHTIAYQIDDGTGTLWVVSKKGVPRRGARVKVRGRIRDVVDLGGVIPLPPEVGSGLVMTESHHKASY